MRESWPVEPSTARWGAAPPLFPPSSARQAYSSERSLNSVELPYFRSSNPTGYKGPPEPARFPNDIVARIGCGYQIRDLVAADRVRPLATQLGRIPPHKVPDAKMGWRQVGYVSAVTLFLF